MGVILAHRIFWSIWDVVKSQGTWNEATDSCSYTQFPLTGAGYNAADIISDVFCTLTALAFNYQHLSSNLGETFKVIIQENILRSVIIVAVNSFEVYAAMNWTDPFLTLFAFLIQNYVYARCLNAELFWIEARKNATNNNGTTASHIGSHAGTATGSYVPGGTTVTSTAPKKEAN
ncbi:hypothetical protein BDR26DRAFT_867322 [Obelidium mucronatum]|nr:hypothetical protein BDR26DRAFT_867322 [Obelidium mucronatum]